MARKFEQQRKKDEARAARDAEAAGAEAASSTPPVADEEIGDELYPDEVIERAVVGDDPDAAVEAAAVRAAMPDHFEDVTPEEQPSSATPSAPAAPGPSFEAAPAYGMRPLRSGLEEADWFNSFRARLFQSQAPEHAVSAPAASEAPEHADASAAEPEAVAEQDLQTLD